MRAACDDSISARRSATASSSTWHSSLAQSSPMGLGELLGVSLRVSDSAMSGESLKLSSIGHTRLAVTSGTEAVADSGGESGYVKLTLAYTCTRVCATLMSVLQSIPFILETSLCNQVKKQIDFDLHLETTQNEIQRSILGNGTCSHEFAGTSHVMISCRLAN